MSHVVRIQSKDGRTTGWQARAYIGTGPRYVSRLFSDRKHGGEVQAYQLADQERPRLARKARRVARGGTP
jgi:hypothetical protein